jgi:hypothetical protein
VAGNWSLVAGCWLLVYCQLPATSNRLLLAKPDALG